MKKETPPHRGSSGKSLLAGRQVRRETPRVLVACEGETEERYFKAMAHSLGLLTADIRAAGPSPSTIVKSAIERAARAKADRNEYGQIWCVFDIEISPHDDLSKALDRARAKNFKLALSNPAIEFWFLLHFRDCNPCFYTFDGLEAMLKQHLPNYRKGDKSTYASLKDSTGFAIRNAQRICRDTLEQLSEDVEDHNSSTKAHLLVIALHELAAKPVPT